MHGEGVDIRFYNVIYDAIDNVENSLKGLLKPEYEEVQSGCCRSTRSIPLLEVRQYCRCDRAFGNDHAKCEKPRIIRDGVVIADGLGIESLRRFKDDVTELHTDYECGIGLGKHNDIQIGDEIETTELVEKPRD